MALSSENQLFIAFKKLVNKANTKSGNDTVGYGDAFRFYNETITTNVPMSYQTVFGEDIQPLPQSVGGLTTTGDTDGIVQRYRFEIDIIPSTLIGANQSQGYRLKLTSPITIEGVTYSAGTYLHEGLGKLQIVPSLYGTLVGTSTEYDVTLYDTTLTEIPPLDAIDWVLDPYNGIIFVQDPPASFDTNPSRPAFLDGFLYVGGYLSSTIGSGISGATANVDPTEIAFGDTPSGITSSDELRYIPSAKTFIQQTTSYFNDSYFSGAYRSVILGGYYSCVSGNLSIAIGGFAYATANYSTSIGYKTSANGEYSTAIGHRSFARAKKSFAGGGATVNGRSSIGLGDSVVVCNDFSFGIGYKSGLVYSTNSGIIGGCDTRICSNADFTVAINNCSNLRLLDGTGNTVIGIFNSDFSTTNISGYTDTTIVGNLAIFNQPTSGVTTDTVLVRDSSTGIIKEVSQLSIADQSAVSAANGLSVDGDNIVLGGSLTGVTEISGNSSNTLTFAGYPVFYAADYSSDYTLRSLPDVGYVTGITNGLSIDIAAVSAATVQNASDIQIVSAATVQNASDIVFLSGQTDLRLTIADFNTYTGDTRTELDLTLTGATNGLTKSGRDVLLGGALTQNTTINASGFDYIVSNVEIATLATTGGTGLIDIRANTNGQLVLKSQTDSAAGDTFNAGAVGFNLDGNNDIFTAFGATSGIRYAADYSSNFVDRSLVDKAYVDGIASGLDVKESVRLATTSGETDIDLTGGTFAAGSIDGVTLVDGDRVLIKNQDSNQEQNGIYVYSASSQTFFRAGDADGTPANEVTSGMFTFVEEGNTHADEGWSLTTNDPIVVGTTQLVFSKFSTQGVILAGVGLQKVSDTISIVLAPNSALSFDGNDDLRVDASIAGSGLTFSAGVLEVNASSTPAVGTEIPVRFGTNNDLFIDEDDLFATGVANGLSINGDNIVLGGALTGTTNINAGTFGFSVGTGANASGSASIALGGLTTASGANSFAIGNGSQANGEQSFAIGRGSQANEGFSFAIGDESCANGADSFAIGNGSQANDEDSFAIGNESQSNGEQSFAIGRESQANGGESFAIGNQSQANESSSFAIGNDSFANGEQSFVIGNESYSNGANSIALGLRSTADGASSLAFGYSIATGEKSIAGGYKSTTLADNSIALGCNNTTNANAAYSAVIGGANNTIGSEYAILLGGYNLVFTGSTYDNHVGVPNLAIITTPTSGTTSDTVLVRDSSTGIIKEVTQASISDQAVVSAANGLSINGDNVVLGGTLTGNTIVNTGGYTLSLGNNNNVTGTDAIAIGGYGTALGANSVVIGINSYNAYNYSVYSTVATPYARNSLAMGENVVVGANNTIGISPLVLGGGLNTLAYGSYSMVLHGGYTSPTGSGSTAIGVGTFAAGKGSIAIGHGFADTEASSRTIRAIGDHSIILSNFSGEYINRGACATRSTIIGGMDTVIPAGNDYAVAIGGNNMQITGTGMSEYVIVSKLSIWDAPDTGAATDAVLVWDSSDRKVKQLDPSNLGEDNNIYSVTGITASTTLGNTDQYLILVDTSVTAQTINLPASPTDGRAFKIKDQSFNAFTNNIVISGNGNDIDETGETTATINTDGGAIELAYDAATDRWYTLSFVN